MFRLFLSELRLYFSWHSKFGCNFWIPFFPMLFEFHSGSPEHRAQSIDFIDYRSVTIRFYTFSNVYASHWIAFICWKTRWVISTSWVIDISDKTNEKLKWSWQCEIFVSKMFCRMHCMENSVQRDEQMRVLGMRGKKIADDNLPCNCFNWSYFRLVFIMVAMLR